MNESPPLIAFLQHGLATIKYRAEGVFRDAPESHGTFDLGKDTRTPNQILAHVCDVLTFVVRNLDPQKTHYAMPKTDSWDTHVRRFIRTLDETDRAIALNQAITTDTTYRLLQGPIADFLTHIGQLAMLRRCAGAPLKGEFFFKPISISSTPKIHDSCRSSKSII